MVVLGENGILRRFIHIDVEFLPSEAPIALFSLAFFDLFSDYLVRSGQPPAAAYAALWISRRKR